MASHSGRLVLFGSMTPEEIEDAVLAILSAGTPPLTAEEICSKMQPSPAIRDVRVALRELSSAGEVLKDTSQRWSAVARAASAGTVTAAPTSRATWSRSFATSAAARR